MRMLLYKVVQLLSIVVHNGTYVQKGMAWVCTMSSHCYLLFVICGLAHVAIGAASNIYYNVSTILDANYGEELGTFTARSMLDSTRQCSKTNSCQSAMFNIGDKQCTINRWNIDPTDIIPCDTGGDCKASSVRKYAKRYVKTTMRQPCLHDYDCVDRMSECRHGFCACVPGYSHNRTSSACVTKCTHFGKTFQLKRAKQLAYLNDDEYTAISLEQCAEACFAAQAYVCRSMEYYSNHTGTTYCYLSSITAVSRPDVYEDELGCDLYTRDCL